MVNLSKFKHGPAITKSWKTVHWMLGPNLPFVTTSGTWLADGGMRWFYSHSLLGWKVTPSISPLVFCFTLRKTGKVHSASVCTSWDYIPNFHRGRKELLFSCLSYEEVTVAYKKNGLRPSKHRCSDVKIMKRTLFTLLPSCTWATTLWHLVSSTYLNHRRTGRGMKITAVCRKHREVPQNLKFQVLQHRYWTYPLIKWIPLKFARFVGNQCICQQEFINISGSARQGHACSGSGYCKMVRVFSHFTEA